MNLANKNIQEALIQLLQEGKQVEVPAHGMSMYPLLKPGDILFVSPQKPEKGDIGVFISQNVLIAHRVYKQENATYYFKGDGLVFADRPVNTTEVIGTVVSRKRHNKDKSCHKGLFWIFKKTMPQLTFITGRLFYYMGRIQLKLFKDV
ncbi:S24/S26 family peptidase [Carboxylicivirga sp. A043]|uniref:S24/S26 family peptidase n=1 Tax=Carboxylicivirga litoralis TaxID=2816963 RepID=UPI0021CB9535|nr:S24/S26 family peptidase [Carboxylicivirga sp. A043]MCU4155458.1 S24/S26 family peptidase [Carboxylicivirga sp. A043]